MNYYRVQEPSLIDHMGKVGVEFIGGARQSVQSIMLLLNKVTLELRSKVKVYIRIIVLHHL